MAPASHSFAQLTHEHRLVLPGMQKHFSGQPVWQGGGSEHVLSKQVRSTAVNPVCSLGARGILHLVQRERSPVTGPPNPWCPRCYLFNCIPTGGCSCAWLLTQGRHLLFLLLRQPGCQPASEDKKPKSAPFPTPMRKSCMLQLTLKSIETPCLWGHMQILQLFPLLWRHDLLPTKGLMVVRFYNFTKGHLMRQKNVGTLQREVARKLPWFCFLVCLFFFFLTYNYHFIFILPTWELNISVCPRPRRAHGY